MPYFQPDPGSKAIAQYVTPIRGTWNSLAVHAIPNDALYDSLNVFLRKGKLRTRPGIRQLTSTAFDGPVVGATMAVTPYTKIILACSKNTLYELSEGSSEWVASLNTSGNTYANADDSLVDIALLETSGRYVALLAERNRPLLQWDGLTHQVSSITAGGGTTVPSPSSVCIAARRVVYLRPPHTIGWSQIFDHTNYPPLAVYRLAQTGDEGLCVRALSNLSFAVYKERSIYAARAQAGPDEQAFFFNEPIMVDGPAGVHAVVNLNGAHMYMTRSGRIAIFTGAAYPQWIADGLWFFLQDDIDQRYAHMIHGVYDYRFHAVIFFYPKVGDAGKLRGMVIVNVPYEGIDIQQTQPTYAAFKGQLTQSCTVACEMRYNRSINRSMLFLDKPYDRNAFIMDETAEDDDGEVYDCMIQLPLQAVPDAVHNVATIQSFFERKPGYGSVTMQPISSTSLESEDGNMVDLKSQIINLERPPLEEGEYKPFNVPARFLGAKYSWKSTDNVRYAGCVIYGRALHP